MSPLEIQKHFVTDTLLGRFIMVLKSIPAWFGFFCFLPRSTKLYCEESIKNFFSLDFFILIT